ncbi:MAG: hypothetical protein COA37_20685 [Hoeflea sp.]|uniref:hypothetical protein n=1 Tax=Hoeflea sp. TaxID=1940281 RepID=UPI000C11BE59|nr:hypothetical protein [Hoeflea sp.]PHR18317.1 MAG: hypothetical protein COA37_20685 [Hoeflea sp.]
MSFFRAIISGIVNHPYQASFLLIVILWIFGVRTYNILTLERGYARIAGLLESVDDLKKGTTASNLYEAKYFAAMSAEVYRLSDSPKPKTAAAACDLAEILADWTRLPASATVPDRPDHRDGNQARWDGTLSYGVWYRRIDPEKIQVALVFRGTQTWGDWWSNARWITSYFGAGWDQYDLARSIAIHVADNLLVDHPELQGLDTPEFIAAGHSLGGGLAQHAGYASSRIGRVYSFNGTSVTGFYDIPDRDVNKQGLRIYRISERGEILALLRAFMKIIYPVVEKNPKIIEATYNYGIRGLVTQHSIEDLACALANDF